MAKAFKSCSIDGCNRKHLARGWCNAHYRRWERWGDPLGRNPTMLGDPEKFFREVVLTYEGDECLIWPFGTTAGYGAMTVNSGTKIVSRLVCEIRHGAPPTPKHDAAHSCGKGKSGCVAKRHLRWATRAENHADKVAHGTHNRGKKHWRAKLTDSEVLEIRSLRGKLPQIEIGRMFNISFSTVSAIQLRVRWAWLK